jgi:hypothetical protein
MESWLSLTVSSQNACAINVPLASVSCGHQRTLPGVQTSRSAPIAQVETAICKQVLAPYKRGVRPGRLRRTLRYIQATRARWNRPKHEVKTRTTQS